MIITKSPLRISLLGGGSDLSYFLEHYDGEVLSFTINKFIFTSLTKPVFSDGYDIRYKNSQKAAKIDQINHPLIREIFKAFNLEHGFELSTHADLPGGTGMGSSSSFAVCLIENISRTLEYNLTTKEIAEFAANVEINILGEKIGKQDHYAAAFGGLNNFLFNKNGNVDIKHHSLGQKSKYMINNNCVLVRAGNYRNANEILTQQALLSNKRKEMDLLDSIKKIPEMINAIKNSNIEEFVDILNYGWERKKEINPSILSSELKELEEKIKSLGSKKIGLKLLGAGGAGFFFVASGSSKIVSDLKKAPFNAITFKFEDKGVSRIY